MAWPKKGTRKVHAGGRDLLLQPSDPHYSGQLPATVGTHDGRYYLYIYVGIDGYGMRQGAEAIAWALSNGWTPEEGPDAHVFINGEGTAKWIERSDDSICGYPAHFED